MTRREAPVSPPVVLTIAGSDSGGGAGIQADLKTIEAVGGFGTSAITSVTAQNTRGVESSHLLPTADIRAQIEAVRSDFAVAATKTGMLATADVIDLVVEYASDLPNLVVDPVMVAASGDRLLEPAAEDAYERLVAEATLVTPNADEAAVLTGVDVEDEESATRAGSILVDDQGAEAALVTGGHVPGDDVFDVFVTAEGATTIRHPRVATDATHGSGCTLSSAIATELAHGTDLQVAVTAGIDLLGRAVRYSLDVGEGPGAVHHLVSLRDDAAVRETVTSLVSLGADVDADTRRAIAGPDGVTVAGATPYAEEPADVVTHHLGPSTEDHAGASAVHLGAADPVATTLLAAREVEPALRFALACRYDEAVGSALDRLEAPTVTAAHEDAAPPAGTGRRVRATVETASEVPVAVGIPDAPGGPQTVVVAETPDVLVERVRTLAAAL